MIHVNDPLFIWKEEGMRRGILGSPSREWLGCGWACGSTSWKWRLDLITTCLGRAGQHRREKDDQEGAKKKKKLQVLQGLRVSLRRWREGRTSKKCKTTKLMGPLVRVGPSLWPWKEERKTWNKGENAFISRKRQKKLIVTCLRLTLARHQSLQAECIRIKKEISTF